MVSLLSYILWVWPCLSHLSSAGSSPFLSPALFTLFICSCRSAKLGEALGWVPVLTWSEMPKTCCATAWAAAASYMVWPNWPMVKVQARTSTALQRKCFLSAGFTSPGLCERELCFSTSPPQLIPTFLCHRGGSQIVLQQAGRLSLEPWQVLAHVEFQILGFLIYQI